jgi:signal transduction histidine kinase
MAIDRRAQTAGTWEWEAEILHDLRTPLSVVSLQAQLLRRFADATPASDKTPGDLGFRVDRIERAVAQMAGMLDELQDVRWSDQITPALRRERTDMVELVRRVVIDHAEQVPTHHICSYAEEVTLYGEWDARRLERAISNLVGNAVKYSPSGGDIVVTLSRERSSCDDCAVITVRDSGIGIPDEDLPHIFKRFYRGANALGRFNGTGLGLASVACIVELHGGTVTVDSREGRGTTFTVRFPLE